MRTSAIAALLFVVSSVVSFGLTELVRRYAERAGVMDEPNNRSSHLVPTPRGGGLAILASSTLAIAVGLLFKVVGWRDAVTLVGGASVLGIVGWIDDRRSLPARVRMAVHVVVAAWALYRLGGLPIIHVGQSVVRVGVVGYALGTLGLVWSINLFNFMDGIDGLAGSQAVLIFVALSALLIRAGDESLAFISLAFGAASLGFLPWNWPRARIFLGDVGSGPIGYLVGATAIVAENRSEVPLLITAIISAAFVVDATVTLMRRMLRHERLSQAHRSHTYQRLARSFGSHGVVSIGAALATTLFATLGTVASYLSWFLLPALIITLAVLGGILVYAERREPMTTTSRPGAPAEKKTLDRLGKRVINR